MPPSWVDWWEAVIEATDCMVIVTQMTIAALRRTRDMIDALKGAGYGELPLHIVCNRFEKKLFAKGLHLKDAEKALGRKVDSWVPADFLLVSAAENEGVPIAQYKRGSKVEKAIARISSEALQRIEKERAQATAQLSAS
jgi:pilus assembly protein CpaE